MGRRAKLLMTPSEGLLCVVTAVALGVSTTSILGVVTGALTESPLLTLEDDTLVGVLLAGGVIALASMPSVILGYRRGRRQTFTFYVAYVFSKVSIATQKLIVDRVYEEAKLKTASSD